MANSSTRADAAIADLHERQRIAEFSGNRDNPRFNVFARSNTDAEAKQRLDYISMVLSVHRRLETNTRDAAQARRLQFAGALGTAGQSSGTNLPLGHVVNDFGLALIEFVEQNRESEATYSRRVCATLEHYRGLAQQELAVDKIRVRDAEPGEARDQARSAKFRTLRRLRALSRAHRLARAPRTRIGQATEARSETARVTAVDVTTLQETLVQSLQQLEQMTALLSAEAHPELHPVHDHIRTVQLETRAQLMALFADANARMADISVRERALIAAGGTAVQTKVMAMQAEVEHELVQRLQNIVDTAVNRSAVVAWRHARREYVRADQATGTVQHNHYVNARRLLRVAAKMVGDIGIDAKENSEQFASIDIHNMTDKLSPLMRRPFMPNKKVLPKLAKAVKAATFMPKARAKLLKVLPIELQRLPVRQALTRADNILRNVLMDTLHQLSEENVAAESMGDRQWLQAAQQTVKKLFGLLDTGELSRFLVERRQFPGAALEADMLSYVAAFPQLAHVKVALERYQENTEAAYQGVFTRWKNTLVDLLEHPIRGKFSTTKYDMSFKEFLKVLRTLGVPLDMAEVQARRDAQPEKPLDEDDIDENFTGFREYFFGELGDGESYQSRIEACYAQLMSWFQILSTKDFGMQQARKRAMLMKLEGYLNKLAMTCGSQLPSLRHQEVGGRLVFQTVASQPLTEYDQAMHVAMPAVRKWSLFIGFLLAVGQAGVAYSAIYGMLLGFAIMGPVGMIAIAALVTLFTFVSNRILFTTSIIPILTGWVKSYLNWKYDVAAGHKVKSAPIERAKLAFSLIGSATMGISMGALCFNLFLGVLTFLPGGFALACAGVFAAITAFGIFSLLQHAAQFIIVQKNLSKWIKNSFKKFYAPQGKSWYELTPRARAAHVFACVLKTLVMVSFLGAAALMMYITVSGWQASIAAFITKAMQATTLAASQIAFVAAQIANTIVYYTLALMAVAVVFNVTPFFKVGSWFSQKAVDLCKAIGRLFQRIPSGLANARDYILDQNGRREIVANRREARQRRRAVRYQARQTLKQYFSREARAERKAHRKAIWANPQRNVSPVLRAIESVFLDISIVVNVVGYGIVMGSTTQALAHGIWPHMLPQQWESTAFGATWPMLGSFFVNLNAKQGLMDEGLGSRRLPTPDLPEVKVTSEVVEDSGNARGWGLLRTEPRLLELSAQSPKLSDEDEHDVDDDLSTDSAALPVSSEPKVPFGGGLKGITNPGPGFFAVPSVVVGKRYTGPIEHDAKIDFIRGASGPAQVLARGLVASGTFKHVPSAQKITELDVRRALRAADNPDASYHDTDGLGAELDLSGHQSLRFERAPVAVQSVF